MTRMTPLLGRNEDFARDYEPVPLALPTAQTLIVSCLDHRVDPAIIFGLQLGEAPVIRNAGGRVTPAVIDDIAFLAFLAEQLGHQGRAVRGRDPPPHAVRHRAARRSRLPAPGFGGSGPDRGGAGRHRGRRPAHHRPDRRRAAARRTPSSLPR
jgi:hypothetical protein